MGIVGVDVSVEDGGWGGGNGRQKIGRRCVSLYLSCRYKYPVWCLYKSEADDGEGVQTEEGGG